MLALFCLVTFLIGLFLKDTGYLIASGLFGIAYAIERIATSIVFEEE